VLQRITPSDEEHVMTTTWTNEAHGNGAYADVNGISLYHEVHGEGSPLVLLHGGLGSGEMFGPVLPALTDRHRVVLVDLQGHGRTADVDRPLDVRTMADDVAALIEHLSLDRPALVGYSRAAASPCRRRRATPSASAGW